MGSRDRAETRLHNFGRALWVTLDSGRARTAKPARWRPEATTYLADDDSTNRAISTAQSRDSPGIALPGDFRRRHPGGLLDVVKRCDSFRGLGLSEWGHADPAQYVKSLADDEER